MSSNPSTAILPQCSYQPFPYDGPSKAELVAMRKQYCNPAIFHYYKEPLMIVDGHMQYLFDEEGKRYLDLFAGIVTVSCGHSHPKIVARVKDQLDRLSHTTTIYLNPLFPMLAKKLAEKMPSGLDVTYFCNSGSEANDLAMLMARLYTGNHDIIAVQNGYHGGVHSTMGLTSHSTWKFPVPQGAGVHHVPCPDPYRSAFSGSAAEIGEKSAEEIRKTIRYGTPGKIAAFIAEPLQGVGGVTGGHGSYLKRAYEIVREHGGVCIADEVQTGLGRTGDHYWGFQNFDVTPDIVTMAKGLGNGAPIAAVTTRREIAEKLTQRIHFNTFGGNPISMAQGLAVLDVIDEEKLQENSKLRGAQFQDGLQVLMENHRIIGDIRGKGLMIGVELVKDRKSKEPATAETAAFLEECRKLGVVIGKGGLTGNILRIKPPMCLTKDDVAFALNVFDSAFTAVGA